MDRVMEIMNYLMKQVYINGENTCNEKELVASLVQLGYSPEEIHTAFRLLYSFPGSLKNTRDEKPETVDSRQGLRIFNPDEQKKLSLACRGELIRLMNSSLLNLAELEQIIAEALETGTGEIGLKELAVIIHRVIGDRERLLMILPPVPLEGNRAFLLN